MYLGKIHSGIIRVGDAIRSIDTQGNISIDAKCTKIVRRHGLEQVFQN